MCSCIKSEKESRFHDLCSPLQLQSPSYLKNSVSYGRYKSDLTLIIRRRRTSFCLSSKLVSFKINGDLLPPSRLPIDYSYSEYGIFHRLIIQLRSLFFSSNKDGDA